MAEITMPRLSDTMAEGTIARWLKKPGDQVEKGDILLEIETDKATMELEAYESGTLQKILVQEGQTVPIGEPIALIGEGPVEEAAAPAAGPSQASAAQAGTQETGAPPAAATPTEEGGAAATSRTTTPPAEATRVAEPAEPIGGPNGDRIKASPLARRLAREYGIDLRQVRGTGPGGRIIRDNIEEFRARGAAAPAAPAQAPAATPAPAPAQAPAAAVPAGDVEPMSRMRRAIARAMSESKPGVPHIYVTSEIDMGAALALRKQINEGDAGVRISVNDMVVKAAAKALEKFPALNSSYAVTSDGQPGVYQHPAINVSVAVALDDGLVAPVVKETNKKSIGTIATEIREMAGRAREGKIKQSDLDGATFQVSNMGMFDVLEFVSIITVPQSASLSVGAVRETPVVRNGEITIAQMMNVTLSVDHRVADGATAAKFLQELKRLLQSPMSLLV